MKVVIVGPGAMGCLLAAHLSKSKEDIWLLDKSEEKVEIIKQKGIIIEGISGNWKANAQITADVNQIKNPDLIIICVKAFHTKNAILQCKPIISDNTKVLTLQNGIGNVEIISEVIGPEKVIAGITNHGATSLGLCHIRHAGKGQTTIGQLDGRIPVEMSAIRELFKKSNMEIKISRDIKGVLWSKLIINSGINALSAITRLTNGDLIKFENTRRIMREAVSEASRVVKRKRIKLVYDDPLAKVEAVCEATSGNQSSMLQDVLRKKNTEIDFINGVVVRQAQSMGIAVPVNTILVDLVRTIEQSYKIAQG